MLCGEDEVGGGVGGERKKKEREKWLAGGKVARCVWSAFDPVFPAAPMQLGMRWVRRRVFGPTPALFHVLRTRVDRFLPSNAKSDLKDALGMLAQMLLGLPGRPAAATEENLFF